MTRRGFTFVEMCAIIAVIAIFAALVVPNMLASHRGQGERLLLTQLPAMVQRARNEALERRETIRLTYDGSGPAFVIDVDDETANQNQNQNQTRSRSSDDTQDSDQPIARVLLPEGVSVDRFILNGSDSGESDWAVRFYGDGTAEASTLEFAGSAKTYCLVIDARKGVAEVREGSISDQPDETWEAGELEKRV